MDSFVKYVALAPHRTFHSITVKATLNSDLLIR
jgi:hypothetical protein